MLVLEGVYQSDVTVAPSPVCRSEWLAGDDGILEDILTLLSTTRLIQIFGGIQPSCGSRPA